MPDSFFDTNILLYLAGSDAEKAERVESLIASGGVISVQVLNEIANVARRKMQLSWDETHGLLSLVRGLLRVEPLTIKSHDSGLALAERHTLSICDAMIAAAALQASCDILWTEDMQDGALLEGLLRITNPFRP